MSEKVMDKPVSNIPENYQAWIADDAALPIAPKPETLVEAVNRWIRNNPGVELPADFVVGHYAKIVCETPRSLSEFKDEDK